VNDASSARNLDGDPSEPDALTVSYRCVCGESFSLDTAAGGTCQGCGRTFTAEVVRSAGAETIGIPTVRGDPTATRPAVDAAADDPRIGETLGHYRIVHRLGQGGMGTVYQALDESLQRYVALKVISTGESTDENSARVQSLVQESRAQARVNHPNVAHIYYVGRDKKSPFFAMELVDGPTLTQRLADGPLPFAEVVRIALQVADALRHCANYDIVHGDIKPSNILQADAETVKLSDFGLAQRLSHVSDGAAGVIGTPNYLSPEAARGDPLSVQSDMYSLGITLFELTFGRLPYDLSGSSLLEKLKAHEEASVEFPESWPQSVPGGWRHVLERLLAKSPDRRYKDYRALMVDLKRLRPVALPKAGRTQRGLAWMVDLALASGAQGLLLAPAAATGVLDQYSGLRPFAALAIAVVPLLASLLQARWGSTPGKKLFQIRIVDRHGLRPSRTTLGLRMVVQMLPIWAGTVRPLYAAAHPAPLAALLAGVALLALLVDAGFALFHPKGRSLHDLFFGTQVVLDAGNKEAS